MRRNETDGRHLRWMDAFLSDIRLEVRRLMPGLPGRELDEWNVVLSHLLVEVFADGWKAGAFPGGRLCGYEILAEMTALPKKTIRRHLAAAARAGLLKGVTVLSRDSKRQRPLEIVPNPGLLKAYRDLLKEGPRKQLARVFAELWASRFGVDGSVQGFEGQTRWGSYREDGETDRLEPPTDSVREAPGAGAEPLAKEEAPPRAGGFLERINAAASGERRRLDQRAAKEALRKERLAAEAAFVKGCAAVWVIYRQRHGYGAEAPPWVGDTPSGKKMRRELTKAFEQYGGMRSAMAWSVFCCVEPIRDSKGKLVYDPRLAHRQHVTPERRPEQFVKNICSYIDLTRTWKWEDDAKIRARMAEIYGQTIVDREGNGTARVDVSAFTKGGTDGGDSATSAAAGG